MIGIVDKVSAPIFHTLFVVRVRFRVKSGYHFALNMSTAAHIMLQTAKCKCASTTCELFIGSATSLTRACLTRFLDDELN